MERCRLFTALSPWNLWLQLPSNLPLPEPCIMPWKWWLLRMQARLDGSWLHTKWAYLIRIFCMYHRNSQYKGINENFFSSYFSAPICCTYSKSGAFFQPATVYEGYIQNYRFPFALDLDKANPNHCSTLSYFPNNPFYMV